MIDFEIWWNSAAADAFRAKNEDMDGEQARPVWDAAVRATQAPAPKALTDDDLFAILHQQQPRMTEDRLDYLMDPRDMIAFARAVIADTQAPAVQDGPKSLKASDYLAAQERAKVAWARRTDVTKSWSALSVGEQVELIVEEANRAALHPPVQGSQP